MNFARAWISRLIRLAKTGLGIAPVPMKDRLQAARETNARLEATIHPNPDYRRRRPISFRVYRYSRPAEKERRWLG